MKNLQELRNMNDEEFAKYVIDNAEMYEGCEDGNYFELQLKESLAKFVSRFDNEAIFLWLQDNDYIDSNVKFEDFDIEKLKDLYDLHYDEIDLYFLAFNKDEEMEEMETNIEE